MNIIDIAKIAGVSTGYRIQSHQSFRQSERRNKGENSGGNRRI